MFELRKRSRSSGSYDQLSQEEDFEELVAAPLIRRRSPPPGKPPSTFCEPLSLPSVAHLLTPCQQVPRSAWCSA